MYFILFPFIHFAPRDDLAEKFIDSPIIIKKGKKKHSKKHNRTIKVYSFSFCLHFLEIDISSAVFDFLRPFLSMIAKKLRIFGFDWSTVGSVLIGLKHEKSELKIKNCIILRFFFRFLKKKRQQNRSWLSSFDNHTEYADDYGAIYFLLPNQNYEFQVHDCSWRLRVLASESWLVS